MHARTFLPVLLAVAVAGCESAGGPFPSLQPRAAEAIDPRAPLPAAMNDRPVRAGLAAQLAKLIAQALSGESAFAPLAGKAEALAASAGAPQSESWTVAQEALSAAIAARAPTTRALGDVDALGATMLATQGGIAPNDLAALQGASGEIWRIDEAQATRIDAIQRRLGV